MTQEYVGSKIITAYLQSKEVAAAGRSVVLEEGYTVIYEDGYQSWSPKDVFEKTYIALGNIKHYQPYFQRLVAEKAELDARLEKLNAFLQSDGINKLAKAPRELLLQQADIMTDYSETLKLRILLEVPDFFDSE